MKLNPLIIVPMALLVSCSSSVKEKSEISILDSHSQNQCEKLEHQLESYCSTTKTECILRSPDEFIEVWKISMVIPERSAEASEAARSFFVNNDPSSENVAIYHHELSKECNSMNRLHAWKSLLKSQKFNSKISKKLELKKVFESQFIQNQIPYSHLLPLMVDINLVLLAIDEKVVPSTLSQRKSLSKLKRKMQGVRENLRKNMMAHSELVQDLNSPQFDPSAHQKAVRLEWETVQTWSGKFNAFKKSLAKKSQ